MPKIIKNGLVYSGVPDETVTAWETADVQDISQPTMGDTDISGIGDGSVTGAIGSLNGSLNNSGSNANGSYLKLPDGTMICWGSHTYSLNVTANQRGVLYAYFLTEVVAFPQTFYAVPKLLLSKGAGENVTVSWSACTSEKITEVDVLSGVSSYSSSATCTINYLAIGRWKA